MVNSISTAGVPNNTGFGSTGSSGVMGKDDFLKLMIAQLKNQDPLSPMDGTQFAAQLAQFSSLEQLANLNQTVKQSIDANFFLIQSVNNTMTANLIGKDAKLSGSSIQYSGQSSTQFGFTLPSDAKNITVNIYDSNDNLVKTYDSLPGSKGDHKLTWDFTDDNGDLVKEGDFRIEVTADNNLNGSALTPTVFTIGAISGIKFTDNGTKILIDGIEYDLGDILEIMEPENDSTEGG